jgi:uncharacterized membrane-anchored protein YjiN (DUF445 family)
MVDEIPVKDDALIDVTPGAGVKPKIVPTYAADVPQMRVPLLDAEFQELMSRLKKEVRDEAYQIFRSSVFKDSVIQFIRAEVRSQLNDNSMHDYARVLVTQKVGDNLREIVTEVVDKVLDRLNKNVETRLEVTRQLTYSVEKEVSHLLMRHPFSLEQEEFIKQEIARVSSKVAAERLRIGDGS